MKTLYIVVPCYNEEEVLPWASGKLLEKLDTLKAASLIAEDSKIVFVDDGSKDKTWSLIDGLHQENPSFQGVKLSRNRGHQVAVMAGLTYAVEHSDATITIDADLQDDIDAIDAMVKEFNGGIDVVYGVRGSRKSDTFFKRFTAESYYKILAKMGVEVVFNSADFRLLSKRACEGLLSYSETNLYLRGIVPQIGYPHSTVEYERKERTAGVSHYPLSKMLALAGNGILGNSTKPLYMIPKLGIGILLLSVLEMIVFAILYGVKVLPYDHLPFILGGVFVAAALIILCVGIVGLYVGNAAMEAKKRPAFFIEEILK